MEIPISLPLLCHLPFHTPCIASLALEERGDVPVSVKDLPPENRRIHPLQDREPRLRSREQRGGTVPLLQGCIPPVVEAEQDPAGSQLCQAQAVLVTHLFVNASFGKAASPLTALKERRGCQWEVFKDFLDVFRFLPVKTQPQTNTTKQTAPPN